MAKKQQAPLDMKSAASKSPFEDVYANTQENTYFRSPMVPDSFRPPYNPDDLWQKHGDYTIYQKMVNDDQVSICLQLKKDLILGSGYTLVPEDPSQDEMSKEIVCLLEDHSDKPLEDKIEEILTAYDFGLSITEKIFKVDEQGLLCLKDLKTRHPNSFLLFQDDYGNVTQYKQNTNKGYIEIDPKTLIHYVSNERFQNPYGNSDLRAAYAAWFAKRECIKFLGIFVEGVAKPIPVGRYGINAPAGTAENLLSILKNFQAKTAISIPKEVEVEFLQTTNTGEAYHKAINLFNMFIGRSLFIPDLMGMSGSETSGGSFALGDKQINVFFMHINRRRKALEKIINRHIIAPIVKWNYGNIPNPPKFKFNPLDDKDSVDLAKTWLEAVKGKTYKPSEIEINHFRKLVKFPEGDGTVEFYDDSVSPPLGEPPQSGQKPPEEIEKGDEPEVEKKDDEKKDFKAFDYPSGNYHKKCNFKAIETKLNDYDDSVLAEARPLIKKIYADIYDQLQRKKIIETKKLERADSITVKYLAELKKILNPSFQGIYKDGQIQAQGEILKSEFRTPTTSQEFLDILDQETFTFIGDWKYNILKKVKAELASAIKDGRPLSTVIDVLDTEGKKLSEASLERYSRTKHTEVLNKGRLEFFNESGVVSGYQYSAILDDRTSEICRGLHGKKFKAGDEPIPPMHFNCRSVLIPITKYESFEPSDSVGKVPINDFIEENKGTGFAKYTKDTETPKETDEGVDFTTEYPDQFTEVITYSKDNNPFKQVTLKYEDLEKTKVISLNNKVLSNE